jgi:integrase
VPTVRKNGKSWQGIIRRTGFQPLSKTFPLKSQAREWAVNTERDLLAGRYNPHKHTVASALTKYERDESPKKRGARWETLRLRAFARHRIASRPLFRLSEADIAEWREDRLRSVSGATVRREMNLWQSVFEVARKEWKWIDRNPVDDVKKPPSPRARRRGVTNDEVAQLAPHFRGPLMAEVFAAFCLGIETAMRAGEMTGLERHQINLKTRVAHLTKTKNGDDREVPLSPAAVGIIGGLLADGRQRLFHVTNRSRDVLFRKGRKAAGIEGLNFHDSRSEGISRLSKKMDVLELARVVGHRDPKSLMHYYRADAAAIARRLAGEPTPTHHPPATADASPAREAERASGTPAARRSAAPSSRRGGSRPPRPRGTKAPRDA